MRPGSNVNGQERELRCCHNGPASRLRFLVPPFPFIHTGFGPQWVSFDPRPPPRAFKGLHGSYVKAIIKP